MPITSRLSIKREELITLSEFPGPPQLPLDLHPSRLTPGQCAQTLMAQFNLLVLQHGDCDYELQCGRSQAGSFFSALDLAA